MEYLKRPFEFGHCPWQVVCDWAGGVQHTTIAVPRQPRQHIGPVAEQTSKSKSKLHKIKDITKNNGYAASCEVTQCQRSFQNARSGAGPAPANLLCAGAHQPRVRVVCVNVGEKRPKHTILVREEYCYRAWGCVGLAVATALS
jgi:hypothetical protein